MIKCLCWCFRSSCVCVRLSAVVHSEIFWGLAERRWTQEPDWRTSIRWPSTNRWVVTSMSWWVKVISALSYSPSSSLLSSPPQVGFDSIGGLWGHISALKEMVVFPLLYPEVFDNFKIQPPRFIYYVYKFFILHTPGSVPGVINKTSPIYWCMRTILILFLFCDR